VQQYRSYRFEVRATPEQRALQCRIAGSCRFVYNKALALQRIRVAGGHRRLSYAASCKALAAWKSDPVLVWLNQCPSQALQQALKDLDRAFCNFASGRAREPRFKRRGRDDRFRLPQGSKLEAQKKIEREDGTTETREVANAPRLVTRHSSSRVEVQYLFGDWLGTEDVLALSQKYIAEVRSFVEAGVNAGYISG